MKQHKKYIALALFALLLLCASGCANTPDDTEDPLSGRSVDSVLPFPTKKPDEATASPDSSVAPGQSVAPASTTYTLTKLQTGDSGEAVTRLQNRLIELGYMSGSADGVYGDSTKAAVKLFQSKLGLSQTGTASISLQQQIYLANAPKYATSTPTPEVTPDTTIASSTVKPSTTNAYAELKQGDTGDAVKKLQARLIELGFLSGTADGSFGGQTANAVRAFQRELGINETGVASAYLQQLIYSSSAPEKSDDTPRVTAKPTQRATAKPTATPAATTKYVLLEPGDEGTQVKALQNRLKKLGFFTGEANGYYAASTTKAVQAFQRMLGLSETGVATVALQTKLFSSGAPTAAPQTTPKPTDTGYSTLRAGSSGEAVYRLQKRLIELKYMSGTADGKYGDQTAVAVKRFQNAIGSEVTGVATGYIQEQLFASTAPTYRPSATVTPRVTNTPRPENTVAPYVQLQYGDTGNRVKKLQSRLKELGYFTGDIGGNYLEKTQTAVELFQRAAGFDVNGVATVELQEYLFSSDAPRNTSKTTPTPKPTAVRYKELKYGDTGSPVKRVQERLKELGYFTGDIGGNYLEKTQTAVRLFQETAGLPASGIATVETQELLFSDEAPRYQGGDDGDDSDTYRVLSPGDSGTAVKKLQNRLIELGYMSGTADGEYGGKTVAAVKLFQNVTGKDENGIASPALQRYIYSSEAPYYNTPTVTPPPEQYTDLEYGDRGAEVKNLQKRLMELGYLAYEEKPDGVYGDDTFLAVEEFQRALGYEEIDVDGKCSADFQAFLFSEEALQYAVFEPEQ